MARSRQGHDSFHHGEASLDGEDHSRTIVVQEKAAGLGVAGIVTHHAEPVVTTHAGWYPS
jgi:hypothetical protein